MTTMRFRPDLNCGSCVAAVRPRLDGDAAIRERHVETQAHQLDGDGSDAVERLLDLGGVRP